MRPRPVGGARFTAGMSAFGNSLHLRKKRRKESEEKKEKESEEKERKRTRKRRKKKKEEKKKKKTTRTVTSARACCVDDAGCGRLFTAPHLASPRPNLSPTATSPHPVTSPPSTPPSRVPSAGTAMRSSPPRSLSAVMVMLTASRANGGAVGGGVWVVRSRLRPPSVLGDDGNHLDSRRAKPSPSPGYR